jgi:fatty-acyl-CoA synthase
LFEAAHRDESAVVIHRRDDTQRISAHQLLDLATVRRTRLDEHGIARGDRVGIIGPTAPDFVAWSYAVWLAGATLVPLPSPIRVRDAAVLREQTLALSSAFDCRLVVAHPRFVPYGPADLTVAWDDIGLTLVADLTDSGSSGDLAVILCTSGSTALPKGVGMSHRRVLDGYLHLALTNPGRQPKTRTLSFLPLSHSAGLVSMLAVLQRGTESHILAPEVFARDPAEWLRVATRIEATTTNAASSAWAAALQAAIRRPDGIDLSGLRRVCLTMEMVDPTVVDQLIEIGGRFGLRPEVIGAMYGLSEGGATSTVLGEGIHIDHIDLDALASEGRAVPVRPDAGRAKRVAGCGGPVPGLELRVVGPGGAQPDREVGEIQFRGAWTIDSYVGPAADELVVDGWMRTGDVGYLADGELFVTGRVKEIIVHLGRNYHPEDIERAAARAAGVAADACVAFSPTTAPEGEVVIVIESEGHDDEAENRVRSDVTNGVGLIPSDIIFVARGSLPKAASGKAQRIAARDRHARGELGCR